MFTLSIETDNAAFDSGDGRELARILRVIAERLANGETDGKARDINGNTVGSWEVK